HSVGKNASNRLTLSATRTPSTRRGSGAGHRAPAAARTNTADAPTANNAHAKARAARFVVVVAGAAAEPVPVPVTRSPPLGPGARSDLWKTFEAPARHAEFAGPYAPTVRGACWATAALVIGAIG